MSTFHNNLTRPYLAKGSGAFTGSLRGVDAATPVPLPPPDLEWAIKTILELNKIPVSPWYVDAFYNYDANREWVKMAVRGASHTNSSTRNVYNQAVDILKANGIVVNLYEY